MSEYIPDSSEVAISRLPPQSAEAERGVLGCILLAPKTALAETVARLGASGGAFYDERHLKLYEIFVRMADNLRPIDIVTVSEELQTQALLDKLGGEFLGKLMDETPSAENLSYYLDILEEKFQFRRLIATCTSIVGRAYDGRNPGLIDDAEREVLAVRFRSRNAAPVIKDLVHQSIEQIERYHQQQGVISGLSTGLTYLDKMTEGLHPEEMTVIAAFPGNGKTSLAINIAEHVAIDLSLAVGMFSLEMSALQLVLRMLASRARVNLRTVKAGSLTEGDFPKLTLAAGKIAKSKIFLDDVSALSIQQIRASARRMAQQHDVKLVLIDYIQLVGSQGDKGQNREQEISEISRGIKAMAKELKVPVLALSQLNDDGKLRESRAIGQDADNVWMIETDKDASVEANEKHARAMLLEIRKQRNGPTGIVPLTFLKAFTRFESAERINKADHPKKGRQPHAD